MDMMLWQVRVHQHLLQASERDTRTEVRYRRKFREEVEPQLLRRLKQGQFICGERFSAADCVVGHNVMWARLYELCTDEAFARYLDRLGERPAFRKAFADAPTTPPRQVDTGSPVASRFNG
jgi:glutathione S-transferase